MRTRRLAAVAAWTMAAVLLMAGCGDDETGPAGDPGSSTSAPTDDTSEGSTATPAPSAEPASGEEVELRSGVSFRVTEGADWGVLGSGSRNIAADAQVEGVARLVILDAGEFPSVTDDQDLAAESNMTTLLSAGKEFYPTLRRVEDREVNGVTGFVLRSETDESQFYLFGADHDGIAYTISLDVPVELDLEEWVEPILASIEWG